MEKKVERNISLDLLKIIGMFMIVCIHFVGYGRLMDNADRSSMNYPAMLLTNAICLTAVPCYFLITGYFLSESKFRTRKIANIWGTTIFYSFLILGIHILAISIHLPVLYWI